MIRWPCRLLVLLFVTAVPASFVQGARVSPLVSYEYTAGSDAYYSHSGSGGLLARLPRDFRLSAYYSLFSDSDYSLIQSGSVRLKRFWNRDVDLGIGASLSGGKLRDSSGDSSASSLDLEAKRYFSDRIETAAGYRFTSGSLSSGYDREVLVASGRNANIVVVQDTLTERYQAHTLSGTAGYEFTEVGGLFTSLRLALTLYSDRYNAYSETFETTLPLPRRFSIGFAVSMTQNARTKNLLYFSLFASKYF